MLLGHLAAVEANLNSPNGLEQCEVIIFDKLPDFKSCAELVLWLTLGSTMMCVQHQGGAQ